MEFDNYITIKLYLLVHKEIQSKMPALNGSILSDYIPYEWLCNTKCEMFDIFVTRYKGNLLQQLSEDLNYDRF
jgi:hypothetical protein